MNLHRNEARRIAEDNGLELAHIKALTYSLLSDSRSVMIKVDQSGRLTIPTEEYEDLVATLSMEQAVDRTGY